MKKFSLPKNFATDLKAMYVCSFNDFSIGDLARVKYNEFLPPQSKYAPIAFQGREFCATVAIGGRMPMKKLTVSAFSDLPVTVHPIEHVIFPEEASLIPDIIMPPGECNAGANTRISFLLTASIAQDTVPGKYRVTLVAKAENYPDAELNFFIDVLPAAPASKTEAKVIFWPHWETFCKHLKIELWSEEFWKTAEKYLTELADGGMTNVMVSVCHDPFRYPLPNGFHRYNHYPTMVKWIKSGENKWRFDYSILDRYIDLNFKLGIDREIECHSLLPCKIQDPVLGYYNERGDFFEEPTKYDAPEYAAAWSAFLADFRKHAIQKGYVNKLTICPYDEPLDPHRFNYVAKLAKKIFPELRITAAISADRALNVKKTIDIATLHSECGYSKNAVKTLRRNGIELRWYNCCAPEWGNSLFVSTLFDAYRQSWITAANDFSGFLRWSIFDWPDDLFKNPGFNWPTGDTYQVYPGVNGPLPSLRWVAWKQGISDLELLQSKLNDPSTPESKRKKLRNLLRKAGKLGFVDKDMTIALWRRKVYRLLCDE